MARFDSKRLPELLEDFEKGTGAARLRKKYHLSSKGLLHHLIEARRQHTIGNSSLSRILVEKTRYDFPRHPEARLETLLRCMNGELKQAMLLVLDKDPLTGNGIWRGLSELTRSTLPTPGTFRDYCVQTLTPAGLLIHELFGKGWGARYNCFSLSKAGERYGQPVAAFSLKYAVDHNLSLYDLFGPTFSAGDSRAPHNRARIIELLAEGCRRTVELEERLGLSHTDINYHLKHLQARGFVRFRSLRSEPGMKTYQWIKGRRPKEAKTVGTRRQLTGAVAQWLYKHKAGNHHHKAGNHHQIAREVNCTTFNDMSKVLVGLARQGFAQTQFASTHRSAVALGVRGHIMLDYVQSVRSAVEGRAALGQMSTVLDEFRGDRKRLTTYLDAAVDLYRAIAPGLNRRVSKDREAELVRLVKAFQEKHEKGPRPSQMVESLGWNHGTLQIHVNSLIRKGRLIKQREKAGVRYVLRK
jgi:DNA-binding MarR family transcriptional regulator